MQNAQIKVYLFTRLITTISDNLCNCIVPVRMGDAHETAHHVADRFRVQSLGLPTVPVFTGVTGAVNGMPSRPVEPLGKTIDGTGAGGR